MCIHIRDNEGTDEAKTKEIKTYNQIGHFGMWIFTH